jgi:hypothetical protein
LPKTLTPHANRLDGLLEPLGVSLQDGDVGFSEACTAANRFGVGDAAAQSIHDSMESLRQAVYAPRDAAVEGTVDAARATRRD